jgi:bifunctional non-homologous end joining protein LigD
MLAIRAPMRATGGGKPFTDAAWMFPKITDLLAALPGGPHVIDGEAWRAGRDRPLRLRAVQARARRRRWFAGADQVTLCAFNLLFLDGRNVMALPCRTQGAAAASANA